MDSDASSTPEIRILLAYENETVRAAIREYFATSDPNLVIVGDVGDGERAVRLSNELRPDVVVMNVVLPKVDGIKATRQIVAANPDVRVIGFSLHDDQRLINGMLEAGARAYLLIDRDWEELPKTIREVAGQRHVPQS